MRPGPGSRRKSRLNTKRLSAPRPAPEAPEGHDHWTLEALKETLLETYQDLDAISQEWIRQILLRGKLKPWREKNVVRAESYA